MFNWVDRWVSHVEDAAMLIVALAVFLVMVIKFCDVMLRYAFNYPLEWSYGFISHYLLVAAFFLALPYTFRTGRHVRVDAFISRLPAPAQRVLHGVDLSVCLVLFALMFYEGIILVSGAWTGGEVMPDFYNWPSWTSKILVPTGFGLLELRLLLTVRVLLSRTAGSANSPALSQYGPGTFKEDQSVELL